MIEAFDGKNDGLKELPKFCGQLIGGQGILNQIAMQHQPITASVDAQIRGEFRSENRNLRESE